MGGCSLKQCAPGDEREGSRLAALDGFRGLLVVLVVAYHAFPGVMPGGFMAVSAFFVLSGFLISRKWVSRASSGAPLEWRRFYQHRARRLMPSIAVTVAGTVLAVVAVGTWGQRSYLRGDAIAAVLGLANLRQIDVGSDYFGAGRGADPLAHFWSLSIEEQFYLVFPLTVGFLARLGAVRRRWMPAAFVTLAVFSWVIQYSLRSDALLAYLRTDARVGEILIGAALGSWLALGPRANTILGSTRRVASQALPALLLSMVAIAALVRSGNRYLFPFGFIVTSAVAGAIILACVAQSEVAPCEHSGPNATERPRAPTSWGMALLCARPMRYLGAISFVWYLVHVPVLALARFPLPRHLATLVAVGLSFAMAALIHVGVEMPVLNGQRRWPLRMPLVSAGALGAAVVMLALIAPPLTEAVNGPTPILLSQAAEDGRIANVVTEAPQESGPVMVVEVQNSSRAAPALRRSLGDDAVHSIRAECTPACSIDQAGLIAQADQIGASAVVFDVSELPAKTQEVVPLWNEVFHPGGSDVLAAMRLRLPTVVVARPDSISVYGLDPDVGTDTSAAALADRRRWFSYWDAIGAEGDLVDGRIEPDEALADRIASVIGVDPTARRLVVFGDSTARDFSLALGANQRRLGNVRLRTLGWFGCGITESVDRTEAKHRVCVEARDKLLAEPPAPGTVLLVMVGPTDSVTAAESGVAAVAEEYRKFASEAADAGYDLLWANVPCRSSETGLTVDVESLNRAIDELNHTIDSLDVDQLDLHRHFCEPGPADPLEIRPDGMHLSTVGGQWLLDQTIDEIRQKLE